MTELVKGRRAADERQTLLRSPSRAQCARGFAVATRPVDPCLEVLEGKPPSSTVDPADDAFDSPAYAYDAASLIEATKRSNRLTATTIGQRIDMYTHRDHGNMTAMTHLPLLRWDFEDQLHVSSTQANATGVPETTFYIHDAAGLRVRRSPKHRVAQTRSERLYLAGLEIHRVS